MSKSDIRNARSDDIKNSGITLQRAPWLFEVPRKEPMVELKFELSSVQATTLRNHANNQQNRLDEIVELALQRLFDSDFDLIENHAGTASA